MQRISYLYEHPDCSVFQWESGTISDRLAAVRHHQGRMESLGFCAETTLLILTPDTLETSEIEGEMFDRDQVCASLARRWGTEQVGPQQTDKKAAAIASGPVQA
jgi:uncharacterized protein DUF4172